MALIGTAAKQAGCHVETVRYYERIGLLPRPPRACNGRRSYGPGEIRQLAFIRRCRDLGFSLKEIHALWALSARSRSCAEVKRIAEAHTALVRRKAADLARIEAWLSDMIDRCGDARRDCPLIETLVAPPS